MATRVIRMICWMALAVSTSAADGTELLHVSARPGSEAAGLNISHPDLPGNIFDFRTCETVLDGDREFGLFLVKLAPPGIAQGPAWSTKAGRLSYEWTYKEVITVCFEAIPRAGSVAVAYTLINRTATPLKRVHLHTCVTTTEAPAFFPALTSRSASQLPAQTPDKDYTELLTRLFLWSHEGAFPLSATEHGRRQVHLSMMPKGETPIQWAWWINSTNTFDEPLIALASRDGQWTAGLWFERAAWASANTGDDRACFHLFPLFGCIQPGASATVRGAFYFLRGGPEEVHRCAQGLTGHSRRQPDVHSP